MKKIIIFSNGSVEIGYLKKTSKQKIRIFKKDFNNSFSSGPKKVLQTAFSQKFKKKYFS